MPSFRLTVGASVAVALATRLAAAADAPLTFEKDVRPILKAHCFQCHGEEPKPKGKLDARTVKLMLAGGRSGPAVVPGKPADSPLWEKVQADEMPEGPKKLSAAQKATLRAWIEQGAKTARPEPDDPALARFTEEELKHWAFQPVRRPAVPEVRDPKSTIRNPIDAFLLAKLEEKGLGFAPEADKRTLLRRATLDLTGLPPTPAEVELFLADTAPDAYDRLVDRLLASPHYGERWGRHWLDVAGYADSEGYTDADPVRDDAWRYRDYVIRAFNADVPWDRFLTEQLAGDELVKPPHRDLTPAQIDLLTATGFLRMVPDGTGGKTDDPDGAKNAVVAETVKVVSGGLLGLTVGCAECHDHRYDPVPQRDYYRLRAVFEPALDWKDWRDPQRRQVSLMSDADRERAAKIEAEAKKIEAGLTAKLVAFRDWVFAKEVEQLPDAVREAGRTAGLAFQKDPKAVTAEQKKLLTDYPVLRVTPNPGILNLFLEKYPGKAKELADAVAENAKAAVAVRAKKPKQETIRALTEVPGKVPQTFVFARGNRTAPGEAVPPGDLSVLPGGSADFPLDDPAVPTTGRRLALARRLTGGKHPLTARVLVNRFWMHHFGRGLVGTPGDFGTQGEKPTHPELLDWLAAEFVGNGWKLKAFHKLVMTSAAYRQGSARHPAGDAADADGRLLWRYPVRRLEAEAVRDAVLAVSGALNRQAFGPPVPVTADANSQVVVGTGAAAAADRPEGRRSVYVLHRRSAPAYLLKVFDAPNPDPNCEARNSSTVAPQALALMNSRFVLDQSRAFAERVRKEAGPAARDQAAHAWRLAYAAEPTAADLRDLTDYLAAQTKLLAARPVVPPPPPPKGPKRDADPLPPADPETLALASLCQVLLESNRFLYVD
jgi:mono/diheme cytochrome c family protein